MNIITKQDSVLSPAKLKAFIEKLGPNHLADRHVIIVEDPEYELGDTVRMLRALIVERSKLPVYKYDRGYIGAMRFDDLTRGEERHFSYTFVIQDRFNLREDQWKRAYVLAPCFAVEYEEVLFGYTSPTALVSPDDKAGEWFTRRQAMDNKRYGDVVCSDATAAINSVDDVICYLYEALGLFVEDVHREIFPELIEVMLDDITQCLRATCGTAGMLMAMRQAAMTVAEYYEEALYLTRPSAPADAVLSLVKSQHRIFMLRNPE